MRSNRRCRTATMPGSVWILLLCAAIVLTIHYIKVKQNSIVFEQTQSGNNDQQQIFVSFDNSGNKILEQAPRIGIVVVIDADTNVEDYQHALSSVECYAKIWKYEFRLEKSYQYLDQCPQKSKLFRRHCVAAKTFNSSLDYILFLNVDTGVVYPGRRIEDFIDPNSKITFYERLDNWEIMPSEYLAQNTLWTQKFLEGLAEFESRLPDSFHGDDKGAIHQYLCENIPTCSENPAALAKCLFVYNRSKDEHDLLMFELCIKELLGNTSNYGDIRILPRGSTWVRDSWLTNSIWSLDEDFMMHGWKLDELRNYSSSPLTLKASSKTGWFNPLAGKIDLELCKPGNISWAYDKNLTRLGEDIVNRLNEYAQEVEKERTRIHNDLVDYLSQSKSTDSA